MASGKVLEETYRKWVQYKDDCVKMIENEPLLQGKGIWQNVGKEEKEAVKFLIFPQNYYDLSVTYFVEEKSVF